MSRSLPPPTFSKVVFTEPGIFLLLVFGVPIYLIFTPVVIGKAATDDQYIIIGLGFIGLLIYFLPVIWWYRVIVNIFQDHEEIVAEVISVGFVVGGQDSGLYTSIKYRFSWNNRDYTLTSSYIDFTGSKKHMLDESKYVVLLWDPKSKRSIVKSVYVP